MLSTYSLMLSAWLSFHSFFRTPSNCGFSIRIAFRNKLLLLVFVFVVAACVCVFVCFLFLVLLFDTF